MKAEKSQALNGTWVNFNGGQLIRTATLEGRPEASINITDDTDIADLSVRETPSALEKHLAHDYTRGLHCFDHIK